MADAVDAVANAVADAVAVIGWDLVGVVVWLSSCCCCVVVGGWRESLFMCVSKKWTQTELKVNPN